MTEKIHILIVDDNRSMAKTLEDILVFEGYVPNTAFSGSEALKMLGSQKVDILLTDVRMPDMNGVELYREMRKTLPNLVTILMTAYAADDIIRAGIQDGIKTVLTKPLDIDFLLKLISAVVKP